MIKCTELLHKNLFYDFTRQLSATLPFSWPFNLLVQSVRCVLSPSPALSTLHLVPFDPILCYFFWSWFKVWSPRSHLITNKFVWLFHCSHLAIYTNTLTHARTAGSPCCVPQNPSAKPKQWDNILISRHDYVVFCVCMCLACSVCVVLYLPKSWRKFALYVQRNNSLPKLGLERQTTGSIPLCKCTLYTTKRLWAYLITSFT